MHSPLNSPAIQAATQHWTEFPVLSVGLCWLSILNTVVKLLSRDTVNCSPSGSTVRGISQARILEWNAIFFSMGSSWPGIKHVPPAWQAGILLLSHLRSNFKYSSLALFFFSPNQQISFFLPFFFFFFHDLLILHISLIYSKHSIINIGIAREIGEAGMYHIPAFRDR